MPKAKLLYIFIAPDKGEDMQSVPAVVGFKGVGLEGDRYSQQKGSWIDKLSGRHKPKRNMTIISYEGICAANADRDSSEKFAVDETRRNLVIRGIDVNILIGKEFMVGQLHCRGVEYSEPCNRPSKLCGKRNFKKAFHGNGGVNCEILSNGGIKVGDEITIL